MYASAFVGMYQPHDRYHYSLCLPAVWLYLQRETERDREREGEREREREREREGGREGGYTA